MSCEEKGFVDSGTDCAAVFMNRFATEKFE